MEYTPIAVQGLDAYRQGLASELGDYVIPADSALPCDDVFLLSSTLQKGLRRGHRALVLGAGIRLLRLDPERLWRRLVICAIEDFGLSDMALTAKIVAAASNKRFRRQVGGDERVLSFLLEQLLLCPRDRRHDEAYMLAVASLRGILPLLVHDEDDALAPFLGRVTTLVRRCERRVKDRTSVTVLASRCDEALLEFQANGLVNAPFFQLCQQARRLSRCILPLFMPLSHAATEEWGFDPRIERRTLDPPRTFGGIPSYALDGHTRIGRIVLERLLKEEKAVRLLVWDTPSPKAKQAALASLLFLIEGGLCSVECSDDVSRALKARARGCWTGIPAHRLEDAVEVMEAMLPTIDALRECAFQRYGARS